MCDAPDDPRHGERLFCAVQIGACCNRTPNTLCDRPLSISNSFCASIPHTDAFICESDPFSFPSLLRCHRNRAGLRAPFTVALRVNICRVRHYVVGNLRSGSLCKKLQATVLVTVYPRFKFRHSAKQAGRQIDGKYLDLDRQKLNHWPLRVPVV